MFGVFVIEKSGFKFCILMFLLSDGFLETFFGGLTVIFTFPKLFASYKESLLIFGLTPKSTVFI
jgi:hypothetical protein